MRSSFEYLKRLWIFNTTIPNKFELENKPEIILKFVVDYHCSFITGRKQFPKGSGAAPAAAAAEDDDDVDLFGSDEEDDEAQEKIKAERVAVSDTHLY